MPPLSLTNKMLKCLEVAIPETSESLDLNARMVAGMVRKICLSQEMWMMTGQSRMVQIWKPLFVHFMQRSEITSLQCLTRVLPARINATSAKGLDILKSVVLTIPVTNNKLPLKARHMFANVAHKNLANFDNGSESTKG